jgi:hypothetical protein
MIKETGNIHKTGGKNNEAHDNSKNATKSCLSITQYWAHIKSMVAGYIKLKDAAPAFP